MQKVVEVHDTPLRAMLLCKWLGLGETDQVWPFHDSTRVPPYPLLPVSEPTAMQKVAEVHDTPMS